MKYHTKLSEAYRMQYKSPLIRDFDRRLAIILVQGDTKKRELLKTPTKIEKIQKQKFIDFLWRKHAVDRSTDP
jgi:hypothetical protein